MPKLQQESAGALCVIGLGKVGAPLAALLARNGFRTIGVDKSPRFVEFVNNGHAPVAETDLQETIEAAGPRLSATTSCKEAVLASGVSFVVVATPSDTNHYFSNQAVLEAIAEIGEALRGRTAPHVVVITSTLMPGSIDGFIRPALERSSGRKVGTDIGLCYSPVFIALGSVLRNLMTPDFVLIGESDRASGDHIAEIYGAIVENSPEIHRMNFVNAELCKLAVAAFVTTKISFANMIASLCNELPGADCDAVTNAMGADTRIGRKAFRGGVGYGGPCFPRDIKAFAALARDRGIISDLAEATDAINLRLLEDLAEIVARCCPAGAAIAILGAAFKPKSNVIEASGGINLGRMLVSAGYSVTYADPQADAKAIHAAVPDSRFAPDLCAALAQADAAVIMTPWPEFLAAKFGGTGKSLAVIDPWGAIERAQIGSGAVLFRPGRAPARCGAIADMPAIDAPALS